MAKGVLVVLSSTNEGADEEEFNEWYNAVHGPEIVDRGAAVSFRRFKATDVLLRHDIPRIEQGYIAIYEIEAETLEEVRAIEQRLRNTDEMRRGISPTLDLASVRAAFMVPVGASE